MRFWNNRNKTLGIRLIKVHALKNHFVFKSMTIMMFQRLLYLTPFILNRISMYMSVNANFESIWQNWNFSFKNGSKLHNDLTLLFIFLFRMHYYQVLTRNRSRCLKINPFNLFKNFIRKICQSIISRARFLRCVICCSW